MDDQGRFRSMKGIGRGINFAQDFRIAIETRRVPAGIARGEADAVEGVEIVASGGTDRSHFRNYDGFVTDFESPSAGISSLPGALRGRFSRLTNSGSVSCEGLDLTGRLSVPVQTGRS